MRILFSAVPAYGHLLPMIPLARAAERAGHEVVVSTGSELSGVLARRGLRHHRAGPSLEHSFAAAAGAKLELAESVRRPLTPEEDLVLAVRHTFGASGVLRATDLRPLFDQWRPDLLVHDGLEFGGPSVAESVGIPHALHSYGPIVPGTPELAAAAGTAFAGAGLLDPVPSILAGTYLDICPSGLQPAGTAPWTRVVALQPQAGEVLAGDELPAGFGDLPFATTVYLTLGTVMNRQPDVFRAVLDGCRSAAVNVVTTTGPGVDPADLGPRPDSVLVLPYLAQALLLPHCDAVISHAGAGTMLGALCYGLPQLCLPQGTDQPSNTAALVGSGAGLGLDPADITPDAVAAALGRLLDEPGFRGNAIRIRAEIQSMPAPDDALRTLLTMTDVMKRS